MAKYHTIFIVYRIMPGIQENLIKKKFSQRRIGFTFPLPGKILYAIGIIFDILLSMCNSFQITTCLVRTKLIK